VVGFWVVLGLGDIGHTLARRKLVGKENTPQSWRLPLPYGRHGALIPALANMLRNKSMLLKLENIIVFTIY
jgi:hypothetical protein